MSGIDKVSSGGSAAGLGLGDVVAEWEVRLADGIHTVSLEHGTTSGKRVVTVDGKEVFRKKWMFSLVGVEKFMIGSKPAEVIISCKGLVLEYMLKVDGRTLTKFIESQAKNTRVWRPEISGRGHRVVLDIETMEVYVDGDKIDARGEFTDTGTETQFRLGGYLACIRAESSGSRHRGLVYVLIIGNTFLEPISEVIT